MSITQFLSPYLYLTILAGILTFWQKMLSQTIPRWHCSCIGFPILMSGYFHHCVKTGDPAEQQKALSRTDTQAKPQEAVQRTHCSVKLHRDWPQKIPGVCIPQKLNKCQGHSKLFIGLVGVGGGIWSFNKNTQISGPLSNTANKLSCLRKACFSLRFYITAFISGTTKYSENLIS